MPVTKRFLIGLVRRAPVISLLVLLAPVSAGQQQTVAPGATVRGRVVDADGTPIARAVVRLGPQRFDKAHVSARPAITGADGRFELANLPAGSFRIEVQMPRPADGLLPPIVYYPGVLTWDEALRVELAAATVISDLTIVLPKIVEPTLTVALRPRDQAITRVAVSILRAAPLMVRRVDLDQQGVATIRGMVPGRYVVAARGSSKKKQFAAFEIVDFAESSASVALRLLPTGSIAGKIVTERGERPPFDGVSVGAAWVHDGADVAPLIPDHTPVGRNGGFRIGGLFGTRQLRVTGLDRNWVVRAVRQKRRDVTVSGIDIVPDRTIDATIVVARP